VKRALFVLVAVGVAWGVASSLPTNGPHDEEPVEDPEIPSPPLPVLLVPGWLDTDQDLSALRARLVEAGWPPSRVRSASFDDPAGSNREHALELDVIARSLLRETGADSIDIVAFSMGGLATRWYLLRSDAVPVRRVVFLATPHRGTMAAHLAWGESREEMIPESAFLDSLNAGDPVPGGVRALTVRTSIDTHVIPGENATLPGVPDREVCCPTHSGMLEDPQVFSIVRMFLQGNPVGG
jgi:triacylglycerol lipase